MVVMLPVSYSEIIYKALSLHGRYFTKSSQRVKQAFIDDENDSQKKGWGGGYARTYGSAAANSEPKAVLLTSKSVLLPLFQVPSPEIYR